ncbi:MFS transporter [Arthrobacter sp. AL08]|uniref:MFS transporter n=1 Tax=Micrococcaceae TaxID=1268 RepID=UPI001CFF73B2|nr:MULTISPECIES: MFS transporter [Micrococcaceae]MDI3241866.1 MFS transporter [Arthrobacter sp. AL05]MDI3277810.1 MFS transporter [Arthrobacter sp. AL08]MDJ0351816.1 MFS transporter [Pseudarthrobacter sp. PH31-O2]WGZ81355.1 MFS transporter [Arthrobacter sp. EM1]
MDSSPAHGSVLDPQRVQRRTVWVLSTAQLLSGVGSGASLSVGSLLAVQLSGSNAWAGAVTTTMTLGAAAAALPLAGLAGRRGRRGSLVTGLLAAMAGALLVIVSTVTGSFPVLLLAAALLGLGTAANLQARFAAVDLAAPERRGRALAIVVWAVTIGAVAGPNLIRPGALVGSALGLPELAGPFVFSTAGLALAALLLLIGLRPDPLLLAARLRSESQPTPTAAARRRNSLRHGLDAIRASPRARFALLAIISAHGCMAAVMSMTPLHLQLLTEGPLTGMPAGHAHAASTDVLVLIGFTISLHIAGMYALSPVMGWLTDKTGRLPVILLGHGLILLSVLVAGFGQAEPALVAVGLILLGLGWSAATIAGSTLLAESVHAGDRVLVQGVSDTMMGVAGAVGAGFSGLLMSGVGYRGLNLAAAAVAAVVFTVGSLAAMRARRLTAP